MSGAGARDAVAVRGLALFRVGELVDQLDLVRDRVRVRVRVRIRVRVRVRV